MLKRTLFFIVGLTLIGLTPAQAAVPGWVGGTKGGQTEPKAIPTPAPIKTSKPQAAPQKPVVTRKAVRRRAPRRRYSRPQPPPALLSKPSNMPLTGNIPMAVITLLADGNLDLAARRLYLEPATMQNMFLIREMQRIGETVQGIRKFNKKDHREWLNLGIAYHNLYLLTKSYKRPNKKFLGQALKAYNFASKRATGAHRDEAEALRAALEMAAGKTRAAQRRFEKRVHAEQLATTFQGATYIAAFHAAAGDTVQTMAALEHARTQDANNFLPQWIAIGFDFAGLRENPDFQEFVTRWK